MNIAVCGLDCGICEHLGPACGGCKEHKGNVFWAEPSGMPACPIYACAEGKGYANCGSCSEMPCETWEGLREPEVTDQQHIENLSVRISNLKKAENNDHSKA